MAREIPFIELLTERGNVDSYLNTALRNENKKIEQFTFKGQQSYTFNKDSLFDSDTINLKRFKNIDIILEVSGSPNLILGLVPRGVMAGSSSILTYYDWQNEKWVYGSIDLNNGNTSGDGLIRINKVATRQLYLLSTHPNMYWLKDYKGDGLRLQIKILSNFEGEATIRGWVVGDKHV